MFTAGINWSVLRSSSNTCAQEPKLDETLDVRGNVMLGVAAKQAKLERYNELAMNYSDETADEMAELQDQIDAENLWDLDSQIDVAMEALRCPPDDAEVSSLSGGEAQRIKLARELAKRDTGRTLYILDEPTTGLHFHDIAQLLTVLQRLADSGNSIVIIEHNLDVIKCADWVIDIGPEGGHRGGKLVAQGTPEKVSQVKRSITGQFLRPYLI